MPEDDEKMSDHDGNAPKENWAREGVIRDRHSAPFRVWLRLRCGSDVIEQRHEPEVHVKLLVAVEQRQSWIVGDEVDFCLLIAA